MSDKIFTGFQWDRAGNIYRIEFDAAEVVDIHGVRGHLDDNNEPFCVVANVYFKSTRQFQDVLFEDAESFDELLKELEG